MPRVWLQIGLLALAAGAFGCASDDAGDDRTYVLVHGAWMGSAGWDPVATALRDRGATVITPQLPAHGDDPAGAAEATLDAYTARVVASVDAAERPVVLVGHSMAGVVISQVAEHRAADVERVVYVAAYVPRSGESLLELAMMDADSQIGPHLQFNADGTVGIAAAAFPDLFCADCDAAGNATLVAGYRDEPGSPLGTPVALGAAFAGVARTYVHTTADRVVSPALQAQMVTATPMDRIHELDTSHVPLLAAPDRLAEILLAE